MRDGLTFGYYVCVTKVSVISVLLRTQPKGYFECRLFRMHFIARRPNYWLLRLCYQGFCHLFSVTNTTKKMFRMQAVSNAFLLRDGLTIGYYVCVTRVSVICFRLRTQPKGWFECRLFRMRFYCATA